MYVQDQSLNSLIILIAIDRKEGRKEGGNDVWYNELSSIHRMRRAGNISHVRRGVCSNSRLWRDFFCNLIYLPSICRCEISLRGTHEEVPPE